MKLKPEKLHLSPTESTILTMLSEGKSYFMIKKHLGIVSSNFPNLLASLRKKTGMRETRDPSAIQEYLNKCKAYLEAPEMSSEHEAVLRKVASGDTFRGISHQLQTSENRVATIYEEALKLAGIFSRDTPTRRVQVRAYLAAQSITPDEARFLPIEIQTMRAIANGLTFEQAAAQNKISTNYAKECFRKGCARAGVVSRGRGSQLKLIRIFLARLEGETPKPTISSDPMDDPSF